MSLRIFPDADSLAQTVSQEWLELGLACLREQGHFRVALSGGSTPKRLFQRLAITETAIPFDWQRVDFFWGDERSVPPDHPDSNFRMANQTLLSRVPVTVSRVHRMLGEGPDLEQSAREYENVLAKVFGVPQDGDPPRFDLVLLGMGPDGHTASLFPHTAALAETNRWVVVNWVPQQQTHRLTFTERLINRAARVWLLVAGPDKADRLAEVLHGPRDPDRLPVQRIRPDGELVWLVDQAAAGRLPSGEI